MAPCPVVPWVFAGSGRQEPASARLRAIASQSCASIARWLGCNPSPRSLRRSAALAAGSAISAALLVACSGGGGGGSGGGGGGGGDATRVYLAADNHTDYFWSADEDEYRQIFLDTLDYYLDRADESIAQGEPSEFQSRWNCDGSLWMWTYEQNRSQNQFEHLIERIKSGHISVPLNALCVCSGAAPLEVVLRGMYYPGRIERRYDLRFTLAYLMENQTQPLGIASLWAGSGARWTWKGTCGCDTLVPDVGAREHQIYRAVGLDGQGVVMKWYSQLAADTGVVHPSQSVGGYAEVFNPHTAVELVTTQAAASGFAALYPYKVIGLFGQGWDLLQTHDQLIVEAAKSMSGSERKVLVSNEADFFEDFAQTYDVDALPAQAVSFGNEWDLYCAGLAEVTARVERAAEKLRGAEALAAIASQLDPTFMDGREAARDLAFMDFGLYYEHDFGMVPFAPGHPSAYKVPPRIEWQRRLATEIDAYVDDLQDDALAALGAAIGGSGSDPRFFAFNPLGSARSGPADFPYTGPTPVHVVDVASGLEVPSQILTVGGQTRLRVFAVDVPAVGYRVFEIQSGAGQRFADAAQVDLPSGRIENDRLALVLDASGAITSLVDKNQGNLELAAQVDGRWMNDLGGSGGDPLEVENAGPVSVTLKASSGAPLLHSTRVTLYLSSGRADVQNEILENFAGVETWGFGTALAQPVAHHEEVGAILTAKLAAQGGNYSDRIENSRYDWLTLGHFADLSAGGTGPGVTLSNADCQFFKLGDSQVSALDTQTPSLNVLAGGLVVGGDPTGLFDQGGDSYFLQRFALAPHSGYDPTQAMKVALEHQNPLVCGAVTGTSPALPADVHSAFSSSDPGVLLWAFKPAEEGPDEGFIVRLWNVSDAPRSTSIQLAPSPIMSATRATHIETDEQDLAISPTGLDVSFAPQQLRTFRLRLN